MSHLLADTMAITRRIREAHSSARYAWRRYQQACKEKDVAEAKAARESVIRHEAEIGVYLQALHIVTRDARYKHMWDVESRLGS